MNPDTLVTVLESRYADVSVGAQGVIAGRIGGGFAVNITGTFYDATGKITSGCRCLFFEEHEIKPIDRILEHGGS